MKTIMILSLLMQPCFLYCMDAPIVAQEFISKTSYFRPIKADVENRHNVAKWHANLTDALVFNQPFKVSQMLVDAGKDATELVCTASSVYGPILRATYIENKPEMRNLLKRYMDDEYFKECFNLEKSRLFMVLGPNSISPAAEQLVRDFYTQDPVKYPLSGQELARLHIK